VREIRTADQTENPFFHHPNFNHALRSHDLWGNFFVKQVFSIHIISMHVRTCGRLNLAIGREIRGGGWNACLGSHICWHVIAWSAAQAYELLSLSPNKNRGTERSETRATSHADRTLQGKGQVRIIALILCCHLFKLAAIDYV